MRESRPELRDFGIILFPASVRVKENRRVLLCKTTAGEGCGAGKRRVERRGSESRGSERRRTTSQPLHPLTNQIPKGLWPPAMVNDANQFRDEGRRNGSAREIFG